MIIQGAWNTASPLAIAICLVFSAQAEGAAGMMPRRGPEPVSADKPVFDTLQIRSLYLDGDFDPAIALLESNLRMGGRFTHADSVFIFKHLGVMYAARNDARERGKYYMHQLLAVEPTARIMDMYASDMIYMIFKNIQEEFEVSRRGAAALSPRQPAAATGTRTESSKVSAEASPEASIPSTARSTSQLGPQPVPGDKVGMRKGRGSALVWIGATGAVVGAGLMAYLILAEEPEARVVEHHVSGAGSQ